MLLSYHSNGTVLVEKNRAPHVYTCENASFHGNDMRMTSHTQTHIINHKSYPTVFYTDKFIRLLPFIFLTRSATNCNCGISSEKSPVGFSILNRLLGRNGSMGEHDFKPCFFCVNKFPFVSFLLTFDPKIKGIYYSYL
jgi:hypothetical protein